MISPNFDSDCKKARLYYYDYLKRQTGRKVPESTFEHINRCRFCKDEINRLDCLLVDADKDIEQKWRNSSILEILGLHFTYIGKSVSCSTVKPFLPSLVVDGLEINIQTPITAHVDDCRDCAEDMARIKALGLDRGQLLRLSRILGARTLDDAVGCSQAHSTISSVVMMDFSKTDAETLKHVCVCPDCRALLYQQREELRRELVVSCISDSEFPCESVKLSDIFCYCLPFGLDPADDEYAEFRESLTSHLRNCPACLAKMQRLHSCVSDIAERPESGVVTSFTFDEQLVPDRGSEINDILVGNSANLREAINQNEPINIDAPVVSSSKLVSLKRYIKPTLAAAAVLLIAFALFFSAPSAKAVSLEQIYLAVEKATNVCISRFRAGEDKPWQKSYISRSMRIRLVENQDNGQTVLWDLNKWTRKAINEDDSSVVEATIELDLRGKIEDTLNGTFGLLPFSDVSQAGKEAQWNRVDNKDIFIASGTEVYDLTWHEKLLNDTTEYLKCRVFVDTATNLPVKTERYRKTNINGEYLFETMQIITYPKDNEIETIIRGAFQ